ncbi:MAG: ABC transporter permease, partial [Anaerolineales bacterium]
MKFIRNLNRQGRLGFVVIITIILLGILVPLLSDYGSISISEDVLEPPSKYHLFGTDQLGRDIFTRTFAATTLDISLAIIGVSIPFIIGTIIGAFLGTTRLQAISWVLELIIEGINAFPFIVLVIGIVAMLGPGVQGLLVGLAATNWARYARVARTRALTLKDIEYIQAAEVLGYSKDRILLRHILPNVYSETLAYGLSDFVLVIIMISGLSYLGLGVRPPTPEWGAIMADGRMFLQNQWWITVFPGLILSVTAIGVAMF